MGHGKSVLSGLSDINYKYKNTNKRFSETKPLIDILFIPQWE